MVTRTALMGLILAFSGFSQDGSVVNLSQGSAPLGYELISGYRTLTIASITKANPAVATSASHGFAIGSTFTGVISGATGSGWTAINAYWTATVVTANTFSIATDSSGFGTLAGTVIFTTGQIAYTCKSQSNSTDRLRRPGVTISAISKASAAIITSTAHGLALNSRPGVVISGAAGTGWTGINTTPTQSAPTVTATVIDADTFSIAVDSSGFGTLSGSPVFTTTAPRSSYPEWAVAKFAYDLGSNLIGAFWLNGSSRYPSKCSDATSTSVNQQ